MTWTQNYVPVGGLYVSALIAAIPVIALLAALAFFHVKAHWAALLGFGLAQLAAIFVFGMPVKMAAAAAVNGAAFGLFPIGWIVLNALFIYQLAVQSGSFEKLKDQVASLSSDRRI